jgi:ribonuclease T1
LLWRGLFVSIVSVTHLSRLLRLFLVVLLAAPALARGPADDLRQFARTVGLRDVDAFVETVGALRQDGRLPDRYVTKNEASRAGWRPGDDLCRAAPGKAIGGDRFGNRERRLPIASGRTWYEADLDFACGKRGAKRLVWSSDGLIFVTTDHYQTFRRVPP